MTCFMAATNARRQHTPRRHGPPAEKRPIVELSLLAGVSVRASHPNTDSASPACTFGKCSIVLEARCARKVGAARSGGPVATATFVGGTFVSGLS